MSTLTLSLSSLLCSEMIARCVWYSNDCSIAKDFSLSLIPSSEWINWAMWEKASSLIRTDVSDSIYCRTKGHLTRVTILKITKRLTKLVTGQVSLPNFGDLGTGIRVEGAFYSCMINQPWTSEMASAMDRKSFMAVAQQLPCEQETASIALVVCSVWGPPIPKRWIQPGRGG